MLGQDISSCGATRLDACAPTYAYHHMQAFDYGEPSPSPILALRLSVRPRKAIQLCILYRALTAGGSLYAEETGLTTLSLRFYSILSRVG